MAWLFCVESVESGITFYDQSARYLRQMFPMLGNWFWQWLWLKVNFEPFKGSTFQSVFKATFGNPVMWSSGWGRLNGSFLWSTLTSSGSPQFQRRSCPSHIWRCQGLNQEPLACKAVALSLSFPIQAAYRTKLLSFSRKIVSGACRH